MPCDLPSRECSNRGISTENKKARKGPAFRRTCLYTGLCPGLSQCREPATGISLKGAQVAAFTVAFSGRGKGNWYGWNDKNESKWNPLKDNEKPPGLPLRGLTLRCMNQAGGNPGKALLWGLFLIDFFEQSLPKFRHPLLRGR